MRNKLVKTYNLGRGLIQGKVKEVKNFGKTWVIDLIATKTETETFIAFSDSPLHIKPGDLIEAKFAVRRTITPYIKDGNTYIEYDDESKIQPNDKTVAFSTDQLEIYQYRKIDAISREYMTGVRSNLRAIIQGRVVKKPENISDVLETNNKIPYYKYLLSVYDSYLDSSTLIDVIQNDIEKNPSVDAFFSKDFGIKDKDIVRLNLDIRQQKYKISGKFIDLDTAVNDGLWTNSVHMYANVPQFEKIEAKNKEVEETAKAKKPTKAKTKAKSTDLEK